MSLLGKLLETHAPAPGDEAALRVLQDQLLEVKDPRGELMALQFKDARHEATAADRSRIAALLRTHREHLLGALAGVVESTEFELGFASRVQLLPTAFGKDTTWLGEPATRFVTELGLPASVSRDAVFETLRAPALAKLPGVRVADPKLLDALARHATPWPFTFVGVQGTAARALAQLETMGRTPGLSRVVRVAVDLARFGRGELLDLSRAVPKLELAARLQAFEVRTTSNAYDAFGYGLSVLANALPRCRVAVVGEQVRVIGTPREPGGLDVLIRGASGPSPLLTVIAGLNVSLAKLTVVQTDAREPGESELDALKNHLRRLKPAELTLPAPWGLVD